jgi:hypothetical protein
MHWIVPSGKDTANDTLEKRLWGAAECHAELAEASSLFTTGAESDETLRGNGQQTQRLQRIWIQLFYSALNAKGRAGFVMANSTTKGYSCTMKTTEGVRRYAAELGMANEKVLKRSVEEKSEEFLEQGAEVCAEA